jgi:hypothetical protein
MKANLDDEKGKVNGANTAKMNMLIALLENCI